jgi:DNA-binding response OmpR family regulator
VAKRNLLLIDADQRSLRVLEVSLRKAGYSVTTSGDVDSALELIELAEPDMIIADTRLPGKDGFALVGELRARPAAQHIPLMFLSSDPSVESKVRGLELGVEDYLTKPVYIREILGRVNLVMERKEREGLGRTAKTRFAGSLEDMGLVDLLQTIDLSRKSGVLKLSSGPRRGSVFFQEGRVIDAELGRLVGEAAIYRFLLWNEGSFELEFREVRSEDKLGISTQALLMEGVRRLDEWGRLQEQLPGLDAVLEVHHAELMQRLGEIPDELNTVLRAFDGQRDLTEILEVAGGDDLATLTAISKLFFDGFLMVRHRSDGLADAQVGTRSDPFIGYVPNDSLLPLGAEPARANAPRSHMIPSVVSHDLGAQVTPERAPGPDDSLRAAPLPATTAPPASGLATPQALLRGGTPELPALAAGRAPLGVVQLKRVSAISESNPPRSQAVSREVNPAAASEDVGRVDSSRSPQAPESEDDMKQRGKRKERAEDLRGSGNVIPLHAGRADSAQDARAERESREPPTDDDNAGGRSVERVVETKRDPASEAKGSAPNPLEATDASQRDAEPSGEVAVQGARASTGPSDVAAKDSAAGARAELESVRPASAAELHPEGDHPDVHEFFSKAPKSIAPNGEPWADFDHEPVLHPPTHRGAMYWTAGIGGVGLLLIGAFLLYNKVLMPTPEEVGTGTIALPTPDMVQTKPSATLPEPAPAEADEQRPASEAPAEPSQPPAVDPATATPVAEAPAATAPSTLAPKPATGAGGYDQLLADARKAGYRKPAETAYLQAIELNPSGGEAHSGLAMLYLNQGKNQQAKDHANQALALSENNDEAWIVLGAAESALGKPRAAREAYTRCAALLSGKHVAECKRLLR